MQIILGSMRAVFLDAGTFGKEEILSPLKSLPLEWTYYRETEKEDLEQRAIDVDLIITKKVILDAVFLSRTQAKYILIASTGTNNIDLQRAKEKGILVSNVPRYSSSSVAQLTITFLLMLSESLGFYLRDVREGRWQKGSLFTSVGYPFEEIEGKKLGIIGYGAIGKEVARKAKALGMQILICQSLTGEKKEGTTPFEELLKLCDFLTLHVPLTSKTKDLIQEKELRMMKKTSCLINVSRGGIVHEGALLKALQEKWIRAAALDVLTEEPPAEDHPLLHYSEPNLILTPHIAWASLEAKKRAIQIIKRNIESFLQKSPENLVV